MASILSKIDLKMHSCQVHKNAREILKDFFFSHKLFQPLSSTYKIVVKDEAVEQNAYKETQAMEREVWG